ncbi:MAG: PEGA domain-containing protein [Acidobacteriales bacterium]|nr:MAG: PEGA domain-containing protein [Terriglobales bacterium]
MLKRTMLSVISAVSFVILLFPLAPLQAQQAGGGFLKVKANSGRAGVFVDGKYLGPAANFARARKYPVAAGEHELILREPRYQEYKTTVKIEPGKTTTVSQSLQPLALAQPPFGRLKMAGFEKYASVFVNGGYMGHADEFNGPNQGLLLNPGDYNVMVASQAGSTLLEEKVTLRQDQVLTLRAR